MTTTPESWDDVGSLRLQVDCISQKVEDALGISQKVVDAQGLNVSQLQKLREEVSFLHAREQEHEKERCRMKFCIIVTAVLLVCVVAVLAQLAFMIYFGSAPVPLVFSQSGGTWTQRQTDELWKMHLDDLKPSEVNGLVPAAPGVAPEVVPMQTNVPEAGAEQKPMKDAVLQRTMEEELIIEQQEGKSTDERTEKMTRVRKYWEETQKAAKNKSGTSWKVEKRESEPKQIPEDAKEDAKDGMEKAAQTRAKPKQVEEKDHDNGKQHREDQQGQERSSTPIDAGDLGLEDNADGERQEAIKDNQDGLTVSGICQIFFARSSLAVHMRAVPPLPFQLMNEEVLKQSGHGVVWVCLPPSVLDQNVNRYAAVFNEVAHRQMGTMSQYPFCYLDTRRLKDNYHEHFCNDVETVTFVLEKKNDGLPAFFRRTFQPDQDIQASVVEDFLNDVHSGKLPEVSPAKGDL